MVAAALASARPTSFRGLAKTRSAEPALQWLPESWLSAVQGVIVGRAPEPEQSVWTPDHSSDGSIREGAWVAELTGMLNLTGRPEGMRVIARNERSHPGAQLRIADPDGLRVTTFATNTVRGQLPGLGPRHRRRARAEDRIRCAKGTGLRHLPLNQNRIWCAAVTLATEITAWMPLLARTRTNPRRWEPRRLRLRLFSIAARLTRHSRQAVLTLNQKQPLATLALHAITTLRAANTAPG